MQTLAPKLIKDALNEEDGMTISAIRGRVKSVYERRSGGEGKKAYTVQNAIIEDDSGTVRAGFWNRPDLSHLKGKVVTISSKKGDKGIDGLRVKLNKDQKKELDVSQICIVLPEGANEETGEQPERPAPKTSGAKIPANLRIHQYERLMLNCIAAAKKVEKVAGSELDHMVSDDQFQSITATFFIQAARDGLIEEMDTAAIKEQSTPPEDSDDLP
jgi:hypothetical protein